MKKLVLVLAVMALVAVASCKHVDAPPALVRVDSTAVAVDSVQVDTTQEAAIMKTEAVQDSIDAATTK